MLFFGDEIVRSGGRSFRPLTAAAASKEDTEKTAVFHYSKVKERVRSTAPDQ
jgi:hypothetical protein